MQPNEKAAVLKAFDPDNCSNCGSYTRFSRDYHRNGHLADVIINHPRLEYNVICCPAERIRLGHYS
jgi:hypothetical protein